MCLSRTAITTTTGATGASHEGAVMIVAPKRAIDVLNFELNSHFGRGWSTTVYPSRTSAQLEEGHKPRTLVLAVKNMTSAEFIQEQCHYFLVTYQYVLGRYEGSWVATKLEVTLP
ncbi:hypothetical protein CTAM01_02175 [Colletotrichum tamarilloi]|uniref:Uncharacterized protein n=1 Tax=Colletotrichum tamarilloi TaxID=1209934 RepID=A0ABQ9RN18_9PEZI|nr:uncharacterized protein CTAM01_02175 [Colletotrichum tamarilloi]KAK1508389.1 hypothetical protein CTAM01_02175 [Colletotrichum tamarilloi]